MRDSEFFFDEKSPNGDTVFPNGIFLRKKNRQKATENWFLGMVSPPFMPTGNSFRSFLK